MDARGGVIIRCLGANCGAGRDKKKQQEVQKCIDIFPPPSRSDLYSKAAANQLKSLPTKSQHIDHDDFDHQTPNA